MIPAGVAEPNARSPIAMRPKPEHRDAVDVLREADAVEAGALVDLLRHRVLEQDAVHVGVRVQLVDARPAAPPSSSPAGSTTLRDSMPTRRQALPFIFT